jgi:hypothetical protein
MLFENIYPGTKYLSTIRDGDDGDDGDDGGGDAVQRLCC